MMPGYLFTTKVLLMSNAATVAATIPTATNDTLIYNAVIKKNINIILLK